MHITRTKQYTGYTMGVTTTTTNKALINKPLSELPDVYSGEIDSTISEA